MKKYLVIPFILLCCLASFMAGAQGRKVTGTVTDNKGPVEGATVIERGVPASGTATDRYGKFTITLKGRSNRLVVTAVGYLESETSAAGDNVNITLAIDAKEEGGVVVVGFGRQKKLTLTGAATSISGQALRQNPSASLQNGLSGRLPGFTSQQRSGAPGTDGAAFFIRGNSSFTGGNSPLIIVDDIEYSYSQFSVLDPNEVESITVLKDASTTAVYGVRGANGVVVVTTRRGRVGTPKISVRTEYASMEPTVLPKFLGAYETALLYNQAIRNDNAATGSNTVIKYTANDLALFQNQYDPYGHPNINWQKVLFRDYSHQTRTNMDITGGTDKVKYFVSLGYINQGGILKDFSENQGYDGNYYNRRFNYRSNLDIKASKNLDLRLDLYGNKNAINSPNIRVGGTTNGDKNDAFYEFGGFLSLPAFAYPIRNPDDSWGFTQAQKSNGTYDANNIVARLNLGGYNRNYNDNMTFITTANLKMDQIIKGLSARGLLSYGTNYNYNRSLTRSNSTSIPSFIYDINSNTYSPRNANVYRLEPLGLGYGANSTFRELNAQVQLNYDHTFGNHHFTGLALINRNSRWSSGSAAYNFIPVNFQGISTRVGYDYKQKYLFQFNGGYNGSDRFQGKNRYGFFPAVSVGWNASEEGFFKKTFKAINQFKIRGSYGLVGSDQIGGDYVYLQQYIYQTTGRNNSAYDFSNYPDNRIYQANFGFTSNPYTNYQEGTLSNLNVTWEKEKKLDIGVDFSLFNGKISGVVDYFDNNRYDILTSRQSVSAAIIGQNLPPVNVGKTNNHGYEFELTYRNKIGKDFNYSVRGTYSFAKNKVIFRDEAPPIKPYQASTGQSIGQTLLFKWTGTFYKDAADIAASPKVTVGGITPIRPGDLKYEDINGDKVIDDFDRGYFGSPNLPATTYGFELTAGYKKIRFSALFQGTGDFGVNGTEESIRAFSANLTAVHQQAWTPALGDNAKYPSLTLGRGISDPGRNSTFWYRSGKYLRLRTVEVSYSLPQTFLKRIGIEDIRLYANGNNLITWSKFFDLYALDPEVAPGTDRQSYPPQKVYNLGLNVTF